MKKIVYALILTSVIHQASGMDNQQQNQLVAESSGLDIFSFATNASNWFSATMDSLDHAFSGSVQQPQVDAQMIPHVQLVREELAAKTLAQAIVDATNEQSPKKFISLLMGMKALEMRPSAESQIAIKNHLNLLQLQRRQITKELLEKRMAQEREIHDLRKQYALADDQLSDDEGYTDVAKYVDRIVNDEE